MKIVFLFLFFSLNYYPMILEVAVISVNYQITFKVFIIIYLRINIKMYILYNCTNNVITFNTYINIYILNLILIYLSKLQF